MGVIVGVLVTACSGSRPDAGPQQQRPPEEGDIAPSFSLVTTDGTDLSLAEFRGRSPVLLYFSMGPG